ncbi:MAG: hypothetical protein ACTSV5_05050 [Promethearchaeota archaeon]
MIQKRSKPEFKEKWEKIVGVFISIGFLPIFFVLGGYKKYAQKTKKKLIPLI